MASEPPPVCCPICGETLISIVNDRVLVNLCICYAAFFKAVSFECTDWLCTDHNYHGPPPCPICAEEAHREAGAIVTREEFEDLVGWNRPLTDREEKMLLAHDAALRAEAKSIHDERDRLWLEVLSEKARADSAEKLAYRLKAAEGMGPVNAAALMTLLKEECERVKARADAAERERDEANENLAMTQRAWIESRAECMNYARQRDAAESEVERLTKEKK